MVVRLQRVTAMADFEVFEKKELVRICKKISSSQDKSLSIQSVFSEYGLRRIYH